MNESPKLKLLADQCVKCGLCLPACPTYRLDQHELESPRGRIALVSAYARGNVEIDELTTLDRCLGCMNCQSVCPAAVDYAQLRSTVQAQRSVVPSQVRVLAWILMRFGGQRWLWSLARRASGLAALLGGAGRALDRLIGAYMRLPRANAPTIAPTASAVSIPVLVGCLGGGPDAPVLAALERLLARVGLRAHWVRGCCGGIAEQARLAAPAAMAAGHSPLLVLSSGCLLHLQSSAAVDATDFVLVKLAERGWKPRQDADVRLHRPCSARALKVHGNALKAAVGAEFELEGHGCCGGAGLYPLTQPEQAARLLAACANAGDDRPIISGNAGCRLQLAATTSAPIYHPLQWLDIQLGSEDVPAPSHRPAAGRLQTS